MTIRDCVAARSAAAEPARSKDGVLKWALDIFFALNVSWLVIWYARARQAGWLHIRHPQRFEPISAEEQILWSLSIACVLFAALTALRLVRSANRALWILPGVIAVAGFPGLALYEPGYFNQPLGWHYAVPSLWLYIEAVAALIVTGLYASRKLVAPQALWALIFAGHFAFWAWLTGSYAGLGAEQYYFSHYGPLAAGAWVPNIFAFGSPVIAFSSALLWMLYIRQRTKEAS